MPKLYHITNWKDLATAKPGDVFTLKPGPQHAEGPGVYFSQDVPVKVTTAEGTAQSGASAVVETEVSSSSGWWRTKPGIARKFNRPITWHTDGKNLSCEVQSASTVSVGGAGSLPLLKSDCSFSAARVAAKYQSNSEPVPAHPVESLPSPGRVAARYKSKKTVKTEDGEGSVHYEYGPRQLANRDKEKAKRVDKLRKSISDLRAKVRKDLNSKDAKTRLSALAVALLDETIERIGNHESAEDGHFGVTGWKKSHITFKGDTATLKYVGKSGVKHEKAVEKASLVSALKKLVTGKSDEDCVFSDEDTSLDPEDVNEYLKDFDVTAKDIRGYRANDEMCKALSAERAKGPKELPRLRKDRDKVLKAEFTRALETVADIVGHEPTTLRSEYLVPDLEPTYMKDGEVLESLNPKTASVSRVASQFMARYGTKTEGEKEDEQAEAMVKPLPKKKPPRNDLRKRRMDTDDPDLDSSDPDLSLNYKRVASACSVADRFLKLAAGDFDKYRSKQKEEKEKEKAKGEKAKARETSFTESIKDEVFVSDASGEDAHYSSLPESQRASIKKQWESDRDEEDQTESKAKADNEKAKADNETAAKAKELAQKKTESSAAKKKLREQASSIRDTPVFSKDMKQQMDGLLSTALEGMGDKDAEEFVQQILTARTKGISSVSDSGDLSSVESDVEPKELERLQSALSKAKDAVGRLEYDHARTEAGKSKDSIGKALDKARGEMESTQKAFVEPFRKHYVAEAIKAAARNPMTWISRELDSGKSLPKDGVEARTKETLDRYRSYSTEDRKSAVGQLNEAAARIQKRVNKLEAELTSDGGGADKGGPYRDSGKREGLQEELKSLKAQQSYITPDARALNLSLALDGEPDALKKFPPVAGKALQILSKTLHPDAILKSGLGGMKPDKALVRKHLNSVTDSDMLSLLESSEGGKKRVEAWNEFMKREPSKQDINEYRVELLDGLADNLVDEVEAEGGPTDKPKGKGEPKPEKPKPEVKQHEKPKPEPKKPEVKQHESDFSLDDLIDDGGETPESGKAKPPPPPPQKAKAKPPPPPPPKAKEKAKAKRRLLGFGFDSEW